MTGLALASLSFIGLSLGAWFWVNTPSQSDPSHELAPPPRQLLEHVVTGVVAPHAARATSNTAPTEKLMALDTFLPQKIQSIAISQ